MGSTLTMTRDDEPARRQQRRANVRLALILASAAMAFFVGFLVKMTFFGSGAG